MSVIQFIQISPDFQPKEPTIYLSSQEIKQMLGINLTTLNNWTKKGILISYGIGGRVYYKRHEVENAIQPVV
jgi:DNA binding domain protein, excisionase family|nr:MAG TPA: helix-turn-helix domain protein [Caudoviricetes sp.]